MDNQRLSPDDRERFALQWANQTINGMQLSPADRAYVATHIQRSPLSSQADKDRAKGVFDEARTHIQFAPDDRAYDAIQTIYSRQSSPEQGIQAFHRWTIDITGNTQSNPNVRALAISSITYNSRSSREDLAHVTQIRNTMMGITNNNTQHSAQPPTRSSRGRPSSTQPRSEVGHQSDPISATGTVGQQRTISARRLDEIEASRARQRARPRLDSHEEERSL
jgi:hypothetical protein